jgi:SAM-dependent methyltransferase
MDDYLAANRRVWDRWADLHQDADYYDLDGFKAGADPLPAWLLDEVGDVRGRTLLHLQCHIGLDTLSWARHGALVTGVDFSPRALEHARALATAAGLNARFVEADVLKLPDMLEGDFDIVFASFGVLFWHPDLTPWAEVMAHYVRPGGFAYLAENHPITGVFDDSGDATEPRLRYPYFAAGKALPFDGDAGSYAVADPQPRKLPGYGWDHSLGQVVTALAKAGLVVEFLHEFPFADFQQLPFMVQTEGHNWRLPPGMDGCLPLTFSIKATKPAT